MKIKAFAPRDVAASRAAICRTCPKYQAREVALPGNKKMTFAVCSACGCQLAMKTRLQGAACPAGKW
ncbi:MAG: hypothetical protein JF596_21215 [Stenotrophomonas sp.]|nr:hypothetical protein [Stenotrophomonas sp.]